MGAGKTPRETRRWRGASARAERSLLGLRTPGPRPRLAVRQLAVFAAKPALMQASPGNFQSPDFAREHDAYGKVARLLQRERTAGRRTRRGNAPAQKVTGARALPLFGCEASTIL